MRTKITVLALAFALFFPVISVAQTLSFKEIEARVAEYRSWLDKVGNKGSQYWVRLDSTKRPHRLYVGDGFVRASATEKEQFVEIFSRFLVVIRKRTCSSTSMMQVVGSRLVNMGSAASVCLTPALSSPSSIFLFRPYHHRYLCRRLFYSQ